MSVLGAARVAGDSRHKMSFALAAEISASVAATIRGTKCSGAFSTSPRVLPSASAALWARSSVIEMTGNKSTSTQRIASRPGAKLATNVESDRRRHVAHDQSDATAISTQTRLSRNSTDLRVNHNFRLSKCVLAAFSPLMRFKEIIKGLSKELTGTVVLPRNFFRIWKSLKGLKGINLSQRSASFAGMQPRAAALPGMPFVAGS